jgi:transposase InsO family protein
LHTPITLQVVSQVKLHANAKTTRFTGEQFVQRVERLGWAVCDAAQAAGVSERTVYRWLARYREEGRDGLHDRSCRARRIARRTPPRRVERIERLRRRHRMTGSQIAVRLGMPRSTVAAVLKRRGLARLSSLEPKPPVVRYERKRPGELLHLDIKKLGRFRKVGHRITGDRKRPPRGDGWEFVHVCVDDHSRLAYVEVLVDERAETAAGFLQRAIRWYRRQGIVVERVMTDNGGCYVSHLFRQACLDLEVRHLRTRPYRPETNGKAERFIQTMLRVWAYQRPYRTSNQRTKRLEPWLRYYNRIRPHSALGHHPPIRRIRRNR